MHQAEDRPLLHLRRSKSHGSAQLRAIYLAKPSSSEPEPHWISSARYAEALSLLAYGGLYHRLLSLTQKALISTQGTRRLPLVTTSATHRELAPLIRDICHGKRIIPEHLIPHRGRLPMMCF